VSEQHNPARSGKITDDQARLIDKITTASASGAASLSDVKLIETRFGVTVPNLSAWRRSVTGDFTGALNLTAAPVTAVPSLPSTSIGSDLTVVEEAVLNALAGTADVGIDYPLPTSNVMPTQETTPARPNVP
jgi:phospholipase C